VPGKLAAAIAAIAGECGTVLQSGRNSHQGYTYASDADLKKHLQPLLAKHGIAIIPAQIEAEWDTKGNQSRCRMRVTYTIAHKDGAQLTAQAYGEGINNGDKAAYVAQTGAFKYLLRTIFSVPTTDDAEQASPVAHAPPGAGHDAEWPKDRAGFMVAISELLAGTDLKYDDVKLWCVEGGTPKPSTVGRAERRKLIAYLRTPAGLADIKGES